MVDRFVAHYVAEGRHGRSVPVKGAFVSSYVVSLLLFLNVRSMFNVACICGIILLHSWMEQLTSIVETCQMM